MSEYKLTFTLTLQEQDDPAVRKRVRDIVEAVGGIVSGAEIKLQQVFADRPPRRVRMG